MSPSHNLSRRWLWLIVFSLLMTSTMLGACGVTTARQGATLAGAVSTITPTAVPPVATPTNTIQPTVAPIPKSSLPTLTSAAGWHTVLTLSDTTGAHGADIAQGSFIASKPYVILYSCKGSGAMKVFVPGTMLGASCTATPKINRTKTLTPAHPGDSLNVVVSPDGAIIWELLVSMQN